MRQKTILVVKWGNSVSTVTGYGMDDQSSIPGEDKPAQGL